MIYQKFLQDKFGQQGEAAQKNNELLRPIVEKVNAVINKIATDENYDYIFDSKSGVVFAKKSYDLTDKVIKALNSGK
jgi:Skp family chaperone for outer membrane proteins